MKIALVGISGSGKTTISRYLCQKYDYSLCSTGIICRKISNILYGMEDRKHLNRVTDMIKNMDEQLLLTAALREITNDCVFDSIRYFCDYETLKNNGFIVVKVECNRENACNRMINRGQLFEQKDLLHSSETEIKKIPYDYILINDGTVEELYQDIDILLLNYDEREVI